VPELTAVPTDFLHAPQEMPPMIAAMAGVELGRDYPLPIVDHATAYNEAKLRMHAVRARVEAQTEARGVYQRHGSRSSRERRG
jgi:deoxyribodipyrimidine photo-lyase